MQSFFASQLGLTVVQSILPGVHAAATVKYVRGTVRAGTDDGLRSTSDLLDESEELDGGHAENQFDLDAGVIAVAGAVRLGLVMRNIRQPEFGSDVARFSLPRLMYEATPLPRAIDAWSLLVPSGGCGQNASGFVAARGSTPLARRNVRRPPAPVSLRAMVCTSKATSCTEGPRSSADGGLARG